MSEEIRKKILSKLPLKDVPKFDVLLNELIKAVRNEVIIDLLQQPIDKSRKVIDECYEKIKEGLISKMAGDLEEVVNIIRDRVNRLKSLINEHFERLDSFIFPTLDDKRIHNMYESLSEDLREKRPIIWADVEFPTLDELSRYPVDRRRAEFYEKIDYLKKKMAESGGFVSIDELMKRCGRPAQEIDKELYDAGFLRQSQKLPNGEELIAYKLPIDEIWLRKKMDEFESEIRREKERIESMKRDRYRIYRDIYRR